MPDGRATAHLYRPKLSTVLAEGYGLDSLRHDLLAGLTVAVIALPLSMAIAIASGVTPDRGLYTAIVGGFLVSALGGSRFQIGGPAAAFIVLVAATAARFGVEGLLAAVLLSGLLLAVLGAARLGGLVQHIPHAVVIGFTTGIALTIVAGQLKDLGGLVLSGREPGPFLNKLVADAHALATLHPATLLMGLGVVVVILLLRRLRPAWPGMLIAVVLASVVAALASLPVETIGSRFGGIPSHLPIPQWPIRSFQQLIAIAPSALAFTLLGGIESLLSAKVADGMTRRRHRSNMELVAQGVANIGSALFGGICVTGTVARTAANIRAGARSPISGILHAVFLLVFILVAAPLARYVPLTALAGVLVVVAGNMVEKEELLRLARDPRAAAMLAATLALTLLKDLTWGVGAGCVLGLAFYLADQAASPNDRSS
jgi:SulP family sulfate permease